MESLNRLVAESFARHGFDRPLDYRRLHWSRWFPCESPHSLLLVPSRPGVFALAEEITHVATAASAVPPRPALSLSNGRSEAEPIWISDPVGLGKAPHPNREGHDFSFEPALTERSEPKEPALSERSESKGAASRQSTSPTLAAEGSLNSDGIRSAAPRRMLAVLQFCEDDDMAFVLDRMFSRQNPMRARLASGRCFIRFVVLEDQTQRRSICNALNQWLISSTEATTGIGAHFASSLELAPTGVDEAHVGRTLLSANVSTTPKQPGQAAPKPVDPPAAASQLDSGAAKNIHCPSPFPSGF